MWKYDNTNYIINWLIKTTIIYIYTLYMFYTCLSRNNQEY